MCKFDHCSYFGAKLKLYYHCTIVTILMHIYIYD
jgi:hypothetical protein